MQLVDEQDHIPRPAHIPQHRFDPLLKISPVLGPRQHGRDIQGDNALVGKFGRGLSLGNLYGQPLRNGGLSHARLPHQHRVILGSPGEDLHRAPYLVPTAHHRVDLALGGKLRQVPAVLIQHLGIRPAHRTAESAGLGLAVVARVSEHRHNVGVNIIDLQPQLRQGHDAAALALPQDAQQQMLGADVALPQTDGLLSSLFHCQPGADGEPMLRCAGDALSCTFADSSPQLSFVHAPLFQYSGSQALAFAQDP